jgi:monoamine oxidase
VSGRLNSQADFAVVGAGLSGLRAAVDLAAAGATVTVFEARDRVGGRVVSAPTTGDTSAPPLVLDLGAQWIGPGQTAVLELTEQLGLHTVPTDVAGQAIWDLDGQAVEGGPAHPPLSPFALAELRIAAARVARMSKRIAPEAPWSISESRRWDSVTAEDWIRKHLRTADGRTFARMYVTGNLAIEPSELSMLGLLFDLRSVGPVAQLATAEAFRLLEGTHELARRLAEPIIGRIRFEDPVRSITQDADGVTVQSDTCTLRCHRVAVCVPPPLANRITYTPALPKHRTALLASLSMGAVVKFHAVYKRPFWRARGLSGQAWTAKGAVGLTYDNSPDDGTGRGVLVGLALADEARRLGAMSPAEQEREIGTSLGHLFGPDGAAPDALVIQDWGAEQWTGGAFAAHFSVGAWTEDGSAFQAPCARIHWAGTETSSQWHGYMEGALRSGSRVAGEMLQARPRLKRPGSSDQASEVLGVEVRKILDGLAEEFGEHAIGGGWYPPRNHYHRAEDVESRTKCGRVNLAKQLRDWSGPASASDKIDVLLCLWQQSWSLWDESLAYHTLDVVQKAADDFVGTDKSAQDWEARALRTMRAAMGLITADAQVFKQINLSSAEGLEREATLAVTVAGDIHKKINALGPPPWTDKNRVKSVQKKLSNIASLAEQNETFYDALTFAATALIAFEVWLATAPAQGSAPDTLPSAHRVRRDLLQKLHNAIRAFRIARNSLGALILERSEPWERLLADVRELITSGDRNIFVPARAQVRYCYPFAVGGELGPAQRTPLVKLEKKELDRALKDLGIAASEPRPLAATEFFARGPGHYGGKRIDLSGITFKNFTGLRRGQAISGTTRRLGRLLQLVRFSAHRAENQTLQPGLAGDGDLQHCKVWLDLSEIGNHCLCIEPAPLITPFPHVINRVVRVGSPFTLQETVVLEQLPGAKTSSKDHKVTWDNLHLFSQDVIAALAYWHLDQRDDRSASWVRKAWSAVCHRRPSSASDAGRQPTEPIEDVPEFERGHLHEVIVVRTDEPLGLRSDTIAKVLDNAVGGKILLRSIQRGATTLDEWVRYPPLPLPNNEGRRPMIDDLPEMGLAGDWCAHTGESTVFGIVAAPSWQSDAFVEAAQFVAAWTPLLRLWARRLQSAVESRPLPSGRKESTYADAKSTTDTLRQIERRIRLHLMQIRAEDLCATQAHRRFLDQLLEMAGLNKLHSDIEAQLQAAERLTDFHEERTRREADDRRQFLLGAIAVFSLFGVASFLSLANETGKAHSDIGFLNIGVGQWEDWVVLGLFLVFGAIISIIFGTDWLQRKSKPQKGTGDE